MQDKSQSQKLWEIELERVNWASLRDIRFDLPGAFVGAEYVPDAIRGMLNASHPDEVEKHYWRLENHVVVQGATYESAEYVVSVMTAALQEPLPKYVMYGVLELIFQMTAYYCANETIEGDLTERCRARARQGIWRMYELSLADPDSGEIFTDLLEKIETDPDRLRSFIETKTRRAGC